MADERIEIEIILDNGSVAKGFAKVNQEAKKSGRSINSTFKQSFRLLTKEVLAFSGIFIGLFAGRQILQAAAEQEQAVQNLAAALRTAGDFGEEATESFEKLASEIQRNTKSGDELILQQLSLARVFARSNQEAKDLTSAAVDLSEATGISLDSAVRNLGKTFSGLTGELGEVVPALRGLTQQQLINGDAVKIIADLYGGFASESVKTFGGRVQQLSNSFGDFLEALGEFVTQSGTTVDILGVIAKGFSDAAQGIRSFREEFGGFGEVLSTVTNQLKALAITAGVAFAVFFRKDLLIAFALNLKGIGILGSIALKKIALEAQNISLNFKLARLSGAGFFASLKAGVLSSQIAMKALAATVRVLKATLTFGLTIGLDLLLVRILEVQEKTKSFGDAIKVVALEIGLAFQEAFLGILITVQEAGGFLATFFGETLTTSIDGAKESIKGLRDEINLLLGEEGPLTPERLQSIVDGVDSFAETIGAKIKGSFKSIGKDVKKATFNISNALGSGIASGVQNFVKSIQAGEDAFSSFAKAALGVFGDLAIQLGQFFILQGISIEALNAISGTGAIAAGVALVALGTILKGISGGSAPAGGGVVATGAPGSVQEDTTIDEEDDLQEPGQQIAINVEGTVIDPKATGEVIAETLQEFFDSTGSSIVTVA